MENTVKVTINGREYLLPKGMILVDAAKSIGIDIPVFCYHPKLKPVGACRMCLVEIEKTPKPQTACTASKSQPPAKTDSRRKRVRSWLESKSQLQSMAARRPF